jgi:hypothetical protein
VAARSAYGSWINLVERWFAELTYKRIRRGAFRSVRIWRPSLANTSRWEADTKSEDGWKFTLSAPILDFSMADILEDSFHETAKKVLKMWLGSSSKISSTLRQA